MVFQSQEKKDAMKWHCAIGIISALLVASLIGKRVKHNFSTGSQQTDLDQLRCETLCKIVSVLKDVIHVNYPLYANITTNHSYAVYSTKYFNGTVPPSQLPVSREEFTTLNNTYQQSNPTKHVKYLMTQENVTDIRYVSHIARLQKTVDRSRDHLDVSAARALLDMLYYDFPSREGLDQYQNYLLDVAEYRYMFDKVATIYLDFLQATGNGLVCNCRLY